uniref:Uncharacterized protein n=1 Tax=Toxoplasma gondii COUG TaxID=1074873 RepID=A0A2G8Y1G5_TOXGO|nr:hypothetical protein TGCOUG_269860 [Toxoplasma gondii COUG]
MKAASSLCLGLVFLLQLSTAQASSAETSSGTFFGTQNYPTQLGSSSAREQAPVLISTFQPTTDRLNTRMVFTQVLNDAYNGGTDGIHKATLFSQELSNSVEYTAEAMEKFVDMVQPVQGVASICYPTTATEIPEKCSKAYEYGDTVYIPITRSSVAPTTNEAYSGGLWREPSEKLDKEWYEAIRLLKKQVPKLKTFALYTGPPDDKLLHYLLGEHRLIFDGLLIDWEFGRGACWSEVQKSPPNNNWMWFVKSKTRYMMANQDPSSCVNADGSRADKDVFLNAGDRSKQFFLVPAAALPRKAPAAFFVGVRNPDALFSVVRSDRQKMQYHLSTNICRVLNSVCDLQALFKHFHRRFDGPHVYFDCEKS